MRDRQLCFLVFPVQLCQHTRDDLCVPHPTLSHAPGAHDRQLGSARSRGRVGAGFRLQVQHNTD